jgi:hypothetical protein
MKTANGFDSQVWTFDWRSRSIVNKKTKFSIDGRNAGNLMNYATNTAANTHDW